MSRYYVDTSVLVAGMTEIHIHHGHALPWLEVFSAGKKEGYISNHVVAEFCSTMTHPRHEFFVSVSACAGLIEEGINQVYKTVILTPAHYRAAISRLGQNHGKNGQIYDCLHIEAAIAAKCDMLLTLNFRDFSRLAAGARLKIVDAAGGRP